MARIQRDHIQAGAVVIAGVHVEFDANGQSAHVAEEVALAASSIPGYAFFEMAEAPPAEVSPATPPTVTLAEAITGHPLLGKLPDKVQSVVRKAFAGFSEESFAAASIEDTTSEELFPAKAVAKSSAPKRGRSKES